MWEAPQAANLHSTTAPPSAAELSGGRMISSGTGYTDAFVTKLGLACGRADHASLEDQVMECPFIRVKDRYDIADEQNDR
jgi:hypothetical protein